MVRPTAAAQMAKAVKTWGNGKNAWPAPPIDGEPQDRLYS